MTKKKEEKTVVNPESIMKVCRESIGSDKNPLYRSYVSLYFEGTPYVPIRDIISNDINLVNNIRKNEISNANITTALLVVDRMAMLMNRFFMSYKEVSIVASSLLEYWIDDVRAIKSSETPQYMDILKQFVNDTEKVRDLLIENTIDISVKGGQYTKKKETNELIGETISVAKKELNKNELRSIEDLRKTIGDYEYISNLVELQHPCRMKEYIESELFKHINELVHNRHIAISSKCEMASALDTWRFMNGVWYTTATITVFSTPLCESKTDYVLIAGFMHCEPVSLNNDVIFAVKPQYPGRVIVDMELHPVATWNESDNKIIADEYLDGLTLFKNLVKNLKEIW